MEEKEIEEGLTEKDLREAMQHYETNGKQRHYLNSFFCCGVDGEIAHMHVIPGDITPIIEKEGGHKGAIGYINEMLYDGVKKIVEMAKKGENIKYVYATSKLFELPGAKEIFEMIGFKTSECELPELQQRLNDDKLTQESVPIDVLERFVDAEERLREATKTALESGIEPKNLLSNAMFLRQLGGKYELLKERHGDSKELGSKYRDVLEGMVNYKLAHQGNKKHRQSHEPSAGEICD